MFALAAVRPLAILQRISVFVQVNFQYIDIAFEAECVDGPKEILPIDSFPLFVFTLFTCFTRYERNKLAYTLLHSFFSVLSDLSILRQSLLHDSADVGDWQKPRIVCAHPTILDTIYLSLSCSLSTMTNQSELALKNYYMLRLSFTWRPLLYKWRRRLTTTTTLRGWGQPCHHPTWFARTSPSTINISTPKRAIIGQIEIIKPSLEELKNMA